MIQFLRVSKVFGREVVALRDLTVEIGQGEFVFLTGPSGAGKSTFLRLISAAEKPSRGQVCIGGANLARMRASTIARLRRHIGMVFQDFKLLPQCTVFDNVAMALEVSGLSRREIRERCERILDDVGLTQRIQHLPRGLSGGEQQRVAIARALVSEPNILLCDEPTGNLDQELSQDILGILRHANANGTTVIVATHDKSLLSYGAGRVLQLEHGVLCADSQAIDQARIKSVPC